MVFTVSWPFVLNFGGLILNFGDLILNSGCLILNFGGHILNSGLNPPALRGSGLAGWV